MTLLDVIRRVLEMLSIFISCRFSAQSIRDTPLLVINADEEFETSPARQKQMLDDIRAFIAKL